MKYKRLEKGDKRPWTAGREKVPGGRTRIKAIHLKFTEDELQQVKEKLKETGLKNSDALLQIMRIDSNVG